MKITKIVIKSESGYCPVDLVYKDQLTIKSDGIHYLYQPYIEKDTNPIRKWKYTTNSPIYTHLFHHVCESTSEILNYYEGAMVLDGGEIKITVTYEDGHKETNLFTFGNEKVSNYFRLIKKMIPDTEYMPVVLASEEDEE